MKNFIELAAARTTARIASIGRVTSETARSLGLKVDVEAQPYTLEGLVDAILGFYRDSG